MRALPHERRGYERDVTHLPDSQPPAVAAEVDQDARPHGNVGSRYLPAAPGGILQVARIS